MITIPTVIFALSFAAFVLIASSYCFFSNDQ